ncbi:hypothetical protein OG739_33535 [Streptomyces longwoodensis]|uniref:hypothetical protein n=1 Tax=Streptomyces longwoodensis TaxID=68231 RepID=UPI0022527DF7|nr:hypothetical protein [Streptomyces longwoodensis]MCX4997621.1 hypothetical protein [Streptomyces longwoodensis]WTI43488.1 hypothetical protein OG547_02680 [Streptomyces longwoodensis]WUC69781.1 hypothetical protein OG416_02660 [Streptomyces longwoodensis]
MARQPEPAAWDIAFESTVRADRLRFEEEPSTDVRFPGTGERDSTSHSERSRLPRPVEPGRDYDDVTVAYRLATRVAGTPEGDRDRHGSEGQQAS